MNLHLEAATLGSIATNCLALREINISGQQMNDEGIYGRVSALIYSRFILLYYYVFTC
jgi:hypothetical protein